MREFAQEVTNECWSLKIGAWLWGHFDWQSMCVGVGGGRIAQHRDLSAKDLGFHLFIPLIRYHRNNPFVLFNSTEAITMSQQSTMGKKKLYTESKTGLSEQKEKPPE